MPVFQFEAGLDKPASSPATTLSTRQVDSSASHSNTTGAQPTYTTAGTLYNPENAQPLQAPLRRGRSFRSYSGCFSFEQYLEPDAPARNFSDSITRALANKREPYSPLQQNYHRAVPPVVLPDPPADQSSNMAMKEQVAPETSNDAEVKDEVEAGAAATSATVVGDTTEEAGGEDDKIEETNGDPSASSLRKLTTNSLQNLASFDNPMRDSARRLLRKSAVQRRTPASAHAATPIDGTHLVYPPGLEKGIQERFQRNAINNGGTYDSMLSPGPYGTPHGNGGRFPLSTLVAGVPYPLTAGPPGHRQHRGTNLGVLGAGFPPLSQSQHDSSLYGPVKSQSYAVVDEGGITTRSCRPFPESLRASTMPFKMQNDGFVESRTGDFTDGKHLPMYESQSQVHKESGYNFPSMGQDGAGESRSEPLRGNVELLQKLRQRALVSMSELTVPRSLHRERNTLRITSEEMVARQEEINRRWFECPPGRLDLSDTTPLPPPDKIGNGFGAIGDSIPPKGDAGEDDDLRDGSKTSATSDAAFVLSMVYPNLQRFMNQTADLPELEEDVPGAVDKNTSASEEASENTFDAAVGGSREN